MILHTFVISLPSLDMLGYFQVQAPGGFIFGGAIFYGGFFALPVEELIFGILEYFFVYLYTVFFLKERNKL